MRTPSVNLLENNTTDVREIVLGLSSEKEMRDASRWVEQKRAKTASKFAGLEVCAADTESIMVVRTDAVRDFDSLLDIFRRNTEHVRLRLPQNVHVKGETYVHCPVLFMYGSVGWQLHLRLNIKYRYLDDRIDVVFHKGQLPTSAYHELLQNIKEAVGIGSAEDYTNFFNVVAHLYGDHSFPSGKPIDLARLSVLAGSDHPQTSLLSLVWLWLGGVLAKHWTCSIGDNKWGKPFQELPDGLKLYLLGDVQLVAAVAMAMLLVYSTHLFPEPSVLLRVTGLSASQLVSRWSNQVIKLLGDQPELWRERDAAAFCHNTRLDLIRGMGIPDLPKYEVLRLCPVWPTITNGGARYSLLAASFILENYETLRKHDAVTWPGYSQQELHSRCSNAQGSSGLVEATASVVSRHVTVLPSQNSRWFYLPFTEITYQNMREEARFGQRTLRDTLRAYCEFDHIRALDMMKYWEEDRERVIRLMGCHRYLSGVSDVRDFLRSKNLLPHREKDWVDPLGEQQIDAIKALNLIRHNEATQLSVQKSAEQKLKRAAEFEAAARAGKECRVDRLQAAHPLTKGAGPREENVMPGQTFRTRTGRNKRNRQREKLKMLKKLALTNISKEELKNSTPQDIVWRRVEESTKKQARERSQADEEPQRQVMEVDSQSGAVLESQVPEDSHPPAMRRTIRVNNRPADQSEQPINMEALVAERFFIPMSQRKFPVSTVTSGDLERMEVEERASTTSPDRVVVERSVPRERQDYPDPARLPVPMPSWVQEAPTLPATTATSTTSPKPIAASSATSDATAASAANTQAAPTRPPITLKLTVSKNAPTTNPTVIKPVPVPTKPATTQKVAATPTKKPTPVVKREVRPQRDGTPDSDVQLLDSDSETTPTKLPEIADDVMDMLLDNEDLDFLEDVTPSAAPPVLKKPEDTVKTIDRSRPRTKILFNEEVRNSGGSKEGLKTSDTAPGKLLPGKRKRDRSFQGGKPREPKKR
jgi:hypothetical protein